MKDTIKKFHGFDWTDYREEELWLEAQAEQGLLLKRRGAFVDVFEKDVPRKRRYRIIFNPDEMAAEELEMIKSSGWTWLPDPKDSIYFYTDDTDAVEIITDDYGYNWHFRKNIRSVIILIICMLSSFVLASVRMVDLFEDPYGIMHSWDYDFITIAGLVIMYISYVIILAWIIVKNVGFIWRFKKDEMDSAPSYAKCRKRNKIRDGIAVALILALVVELGVLSNPGGYRSYYGNDALAYESELLVPFESIDNVEWNRIKDAIPESKDVIDSSKKDSAVMSIETFSALLLFKKEISQKVEITTQKFDSEMGEYNSSVIYTQSSYEAKSENIAEKYLEEEILTKPEWKDDQFYYNHLDKSYLKDIEISVAGADYAGYEPGDKYDDETDEVHTQSLYIRRGSKFTVVSYRGDENLKDKAALFADKLK